MPEIVIVDCGCQIALLVKVQGACAIMGSRKYSVDDLKPGMVLARTIFADDGRNVISERSVLTAQQIFLLYSWGVSSAEIVDLDGEALEEQAFCRFAQAYTAMSSILTDIFAKARLLKTLPADEMEELAEKTATVIAGGTGVLGYLAMIHSTDDYVFRHSANVGIIAGLVGKWIGCGGETLAELILAGLMHDIGKTQIPLQILNKPGDLNSYEWGILKQHPSLGFELLQSALRPAESVLSGVLQHHERVDGSGYPFGLPGDEISSSARIIAIADIYDSMTSNRSYRSAETPFRAVEEIHRQMFGKLDPKVCGVFIAKAFEAFIGMGVGLSDGSEATVIAMDRSALATPIVRSKTGRYTSLAESDLTIVRVLPGG